MQCSDWRTQACACACVRVRACDRVLTRDQAGHGPNLQDVGGGLAERAQTSAGLQGTASSTPGSRQAGPTAWRARETPSPALRWRGGTFDPSARRQGPPPLRQCAPPDSVGTALGHVTYMCASPAYPLRCHPQGRKSLCPAPGPGAQQGLTRLTLSRRLPVTRRDSISSCSSPCSHT